MADTRRQQELRETSRSSDINGSLSSNTHQSIGDQLRQFLETMRELRNLQETEGIIDYHEKFVAICSKVPFSEPYLVSVFLAGLRSDTQMNVRMFRPQSIHQCLLVGRLYESVHPCKPKEVIDERSAIQNDSSHTKEEVTVALTEMAIHPEEASEVVSDLDEIPPDSKVTSYFLVAYEDVSATFIDELEFAKEPMESWNEVVEKVMSFPDFLESHSAHYMFDEMPTIEFQLFPCSCSLNADLMSGFGHSDLFGDPLSFVFDPGKQMTNWFCAHKSTVFLVLDAWLSTFGVSIRSLAHDSSRIFIFDPGIAYIGVCTAFAALVVILMTWNLLRLLIMKLVLKR